MDLFMSDLHAGLATLQRIVMFPLFLHTYEDGLGCIVCVKLGHLALRDRREVWLWDELMAAWYHGIRLGIG